MKGRTVAGAEIGLRPEAQEIDRTVLTVEGQPEWLSGTTCGPDRLPEPSPGTAQSAAYVNSFGGVG